MGKPCALQERDAGEAACRCCMRAAEELTQTRKQNFFSCSVPSLPLIDKTSWQLAKKNHI